LNILNDYIDLIRQLRRHKQDINATKDFVIKQTVHVYVPEQLKSGEYVTNCVTCNRTCHFPCSIPQDQDKSGCAVMSGGVCTVCPKKCEWRAHRNNDIKYVMVARTVETRAEDLYNKHCSAKTNKSKFYQVMKGKLSEWSEARNKVKISVAQIHRSNLRLNEIALRKKTVSLADYLDMMIDAEKAEQQPGWQARAGSYAQLKAEEELLRKVADPNYDPAASQRELMESLLQEIDKEGGEDVDEEENKIKQQTKEIVGTNMLTSTKVTFVKNVQKVVNNQFNYWFGKK
jgi:hypothetical protein